MEGLNQRTCVRLFSPFPSPPMPLPPPPPRTAPKSLILRLALPLARVLTRNKVKSSLVFLIFVAHGRRTRSDGLELLTTIIPVFRSASDNIVPTLLAGKSAGKKLTKKIFCVSRVYVCYRFRFALIGQILTARTAGSLGEYWRRHSKFQRHGCKLSLLGEILL